MKYALLILALLATPAIARDLPPDPPSFDKPTFDRPDRPEPPEPPEPPTVDNEEEERPEPPVVVGKPKKKMVPGLRCYFDEHGVRKVSFNKLVDPEFYKMGRKFCSKVPYKVMDVSLHCVEENGKYQVRFSEQLHSHKAIKKGQQFCICVFGLD